MKLVVIGVGRLRERFYREAADEYIKRLGRYGKIEEVEVEDLPEPTKPSQALAKRVCDEEARRILRAVRPGDRVIALCVEGNQMDSVAFSAFLERQADQAQGRVVLVLGGSLGLGEGVLARAQARISLSKMTLPHQLARVVLLEQLYRAAKISAGERYHK